MGEESTEPKAASAKAAPQAPMNDNVVYPIVFASGRAAFPDGSHLDTTRRHMPPAREVPRDNAAAQMPALRSLADRAMRDEPPKSLTALHTYWFCLGDGLPPDRSLINPAAIAPLLPDLLLLERDARRSRLRYRLTGTRVDHWNGRNLTGRYLDEVAAQDRTGITDFIRRHCQQVLRNRQAYIGHYDWYAAAPDPREFFAANRPAGSSLAGNSLAGSSLVGSSLVGHPLASSFAPGQHRRWQLPLALLRRPIRLWLGLFPLRVGGHVRQCLAIAEQDGQPIDTAPAPWILDGHPSGGVIPGRWRDA
ncbi:PAS domain-containing protein [Dongia soli]|uniref:PAS domain-containing protein n=1 Tax=Dongia soli TaxID=600628 RepID=A0ABU5EEV6_9PROT|nr:PAS domain-containing protein [Dongia soli]MDY0884697.1 PAS domain-containing protein [Dongia soli]